MIDLNALNDEILGGLKNEESRLDDASEAADFFRGRFDAYGSRPPTSAWEGARYKRESRIMTWLVDTLAANLYSAGPTRKLPGHPGADEWLNATYKTSSIDALMQSADAWSCVGQVAAIQAIPAEDPARPVRHALWPAHQLCVWESEDDPLKPDAVATIDRHDNRRRLRLWTADRRLTYTSEKLMPGQTAGGREFTLAEQVDNPFGILPFSFVHYNYPTTEFWSSGPGTAFKELNDYINCALTESGDALRYCAKPIVLLLGSRPGWRPSTPCQPGDIWEVPGQGGDVDGGGAVERPDASYLLPDMSFIDAHWTDLQSYLDHSMQTAGVPPSLFRLTQDGAASGLSIIAEQLPLVLRAEGRQRPFAHYELDLARVTLTVGAAHLAANGIAGHEELRQAAADPDLTLRWPSMRPKLTGKEADESDAQALEERTMSRTMIIMGREGLNREEAEAYLDQVAEDLEREQELFADLDAARVARAMALKPDPNDPNGTTKPAPTRADDPDLDPDESDNTDG